MTNQMTAKRAKRAKIAPAVTMATLETSIKANVAAFSNAATSLTSQLITFAMAKMAIEGLTANHAVNQTLDMIDANACDYSLNYIKQAKTRLDAAFAYGLIDGVKLGNIKIASTDETAVIHECEAHVSRLDIKATLAARAEKNAGKKGGKKAAVTPHVTVGDATIVNTAPVDYSPAVLARTEQEVGVLINRLIDGGALDALKRIQMFLNAELATPAQEAQEAITA